MPKLIAAARSPKAGRLANDLSASAAYVLARIPVGRNPRAIQVSPDGKTLYVANRLDDTISVVDTARAAVAAEIPLGAPTPLTPERRGERLFYSSMYSFGHQFGCANCHLDSTFDGLSWDLEPDGFGIDIVDNRALEEIKDTAPYKWNGGNPDLQTECGPRTERFFFRSEGFRGADLEDLVKYIKSIPLRPNRYRLPNGELTAGAGTGAGALHADGQEGWNTDSRTSAVRGLSCRPALYRQCLAGCRYGEAFGPFAAGGYTTVDQCSEQRAVSA